MFTLGNSTFNRLCHNPDAGYGSSTPSSPIKVERTANYFKAQFEEARKSDNGSRDLDLSDGRITIAKPKDGAQNAYEDTIRLGGTKDDGWMETYRFVTFDDGRNPEEVTTQLTLKNGRAEEHEMVCQVYRVDSFTHTLADPQAVEKSGTTTWNAEFMSSYETECFWHGK